MERITICLLVALLVMRLALSGFNIMMRTIKVLFTISLPIFLLYLSNIIIFNEYPVFIGCFCGSGIYLNSLIRINSFDKLLDNFLDNEKKKLSTEDCINVVLIFILTFLFMGLIYASGIYDELGYPFWGTSLIFLLMSHFKIPKRFFS